MDKNGFQFRFVAASYLAWRAMQRYVIDQLPPEFRYDLTTGRYAGSAGELVGKSMRASDVVDKVVKGNSVPVWIDIMVDRIEKRTTVFSVECSDRYESDETKLYYTWNGTAPFNIKCGHFPQEWLRYELCGVPPKMKFRLCPTFWNQFWDFVLLRFLFCRLDPETVAIEKECVTRLHRQKTTMTQAENGNVDDGKPSAS